MRLIGPSPASASIGAPARTSEFTLSGKRAATIEIWPRAPRRLLDRGCANAANDGPRRLVTSGSPIPTILITAYVDEKVRAEALKAGVACYLPKPIDESKLLACIHSAIGDQRTDKTEC